MTSAGMITVVAGNGFAGYSGDGGLAINAEFNNPIGVAVDGANPANIYISDSNNCLVRKVTASNGMVTTVAGLVNHPSPGSASPQCGYGGDGAAADAAQLNDPLGVAFNSKTNTLYIADYNNGRIRTVAGASPTSIITTVAGGGVQPTKAIPARGALPTETADRLQAHIYADLKV